MTSSHDHALLSPSGASCWGYCPVALREQKDIPRTSSKYADEGTAAHELAALTLTSKHKHAKTYLTRILIGGFEATEDMCEHVQTYVDTVMSYYTEGDTLLVEHRVGFGKSLGVDPQLAFGTADAIIVKPDGRIFVFDLKYGMGIRVEADSNEQMMLYGLGVLEQYDILDDFTEINLLICQPRLEHISGCMYPVEVLRTWGKEFGKRAQLAVDYLASALPPGREAYVPDEDTCRWCRAKPTCPALAEMVAQTLAIPFEDLTTSKEIAILPPVPTLLGNLMGKIDLIEDWCRAIRVAVFEELNNGREVPGYKLVSGRKGARDWIDAVEAEKALKALRLVQADMYTMKLASPTKMEKVLKDSPTRWKRIQHLIMQPTGKPSVAPISDKRPALEVKPLEFEVLGETASSLTYEGVEIC